ncbi:MAG: hypothetical protein OHK0036_01980 [Bacteroidia bacterium]
MFKGLIVFYICQQKFTTMKTKLYIIGLAVSMASVAQQNKIIQPTQSAALTLSVQNVAPSCFTPCTGAATIIVFGGTAPYSYTVSGAGSITGTSNTNTFVVNNLCAFPYGIGVCDATMFNCGYTTFTVNSIPYPTITNHNYAPAGPPNPPFLYNATVTISGGSSPYYTTWYNSMGMPIKNHTITTNADTAYLYPGDYYVTVTDANNVTNGCSGISMYSYSFSICDNSGMLPPGGITIIPNDTLCSGTTFTVNFYTGPWCMYGMFTSDNPSCGPASGACSTFTVCMATQNTTFSGQWWYAMGCAPVTIPSETLVVQTCTGIYNLNSNDIFSIVPNPNNGEFELLSNRYINGEAQIIDLTGKILISEKINEDKKLKVNLSDGVYYIRVYSAEGVQQQKLMIIR